MSDHPFLTDHVKAFLWQEVINHRNAIASGDLDPAITDAPTLRSALDSLQQAPEDIALGWFAINAVGLEDEADQFACLADQYLNLARLIAVEGPDKKLLELV